MRPHRFLQSFFGGICLMLLLFPSLGLLSQAQPELDSPVVQGEKAPQPIELKPDLTSEMEAPISRTWWERLHHDDLNTVVISALLNNLELRSREAEVLAMKHQIKKQFALELPTVSLGTSFLRQKNSATLLSPNASQFRSGGAQVFSPGSTFNIYNLPLSFNYELDLFQKHRLMTKAVTLRYQAELCQLRDLELALAEHTTATVLNALANDTLQYLTTKRLVTLEEIQHLQRVRFESGLTAQDDSLSSEEAVDRLKAVLAQLKKDGQSLEHEIAYLSGQAIGSATWRKMNQDPSAFFPALPLSPFYEWTRINSTLLTHRPDVAVRELQLQAAGMDVQVARRMFLPTFTLTAQLGLASTTLNNWFDWNSILTSVGASMAQQLFAGGSIRANLKEQKARYESFGHLYQNQLLLAGRDTENALVDLKKNLDTQGFVQNQLAHERVKYQLSMGRYQAGIESYVHTLEEQDAVLQLAEQELTARRDALLAWNHVARELGGGF